MRLLSTLRNFVAFLLFPVLLQAAESRSRVEELFLWKISDEMKLSVPEEKSFSELIRGLNQKKATANGKIQGVLLKLSKSTSRKEKEKLLAEHRRLLKEYNGYSLDEVDGIQKLFGTDKSAQYFVLKNDLTVRLKNLLAIPEKPTSPSAADKMAPPQVVEQK